MPCLQAESRSQYTTPSEDMQTLPLVVLTSVQRKKTRMCLWEWNVISSSFERHCIQLSDHLVKNNWHDLHEKQVQLFDIHFHEITITTEYFLHCIIHDDISLTLNWCWEASGHAFSQTIESIFSHTQGSTFPIIFPMDFICPFSCPWITQPSGCFKLTLKSSHEICRTSRAGLWYTYKTLVCSV